MRHMVIGIDCVCSTKQTHSVRLKSNAGEYEGKTCCEHRKSLFVCVVKE